MARAIEDRGVPGIGCLIMTITEFFAHLRDLGFYDDGSTSACEALRLDLQQDRGYILVTDNDLRIPDGTKPIFVGSYAIDGSQIEARMAPSPRAALACIHRLMSSHGKVMSADGSA
ncbi:MAG: hypothetical protein L6R28_06680 [Planctomycetes bacterium]|nr:hypothetical protein [Planctomycetota bacterium]